MGRSILAMLAHWRRRYGTWHITVMGDGYDKEHVIVLSGSHNQKDAEAIARYQVAKAYGDSITNFFIKEAHREG